MASVHFVAVPVEAVKADDAGDRFNVCNLGDPPPDYQDRLTATHTRHWVDKFHVGYTVVDLQGGVLAWVRDAARAGAITGRFPGHFREELGAACADLPPLPAAANFVRGDAVSLKTGMHGVGPFTTWRAILEGLVTCRPNHTPLVPEAVRDGRLRLYILPWRDVDADFEFRGFVVRGRLTALSQQHWYRPAPRLQADVEGGGGRVRALIAHVQAAVLPAFGDATYTVDVALLTDGQPYFIEPNGFGAGYAAGSSLFHWTRDHACLHDASGVTVRYVA